MLGLKWTPLNMVVDTSLIRNTKSQQIETMVISCVQSKRKNNFGVVFKYVTKKYIYSLNITVTLLFLYAYNITGQLKTIFSIEPTIKSVCKIERINVGNRWKATALLQGRSSISMTYVGLRRWVEVDNACPDDGRARVQCLCCIHGWLVKYLELFPQLTGQHSTPSLLTVCPVRRPSLGGGVGGVSSPGTWF